MIDFQSIAAAALNRGTSLLGDWFPAGRLSGNEYLVGNLQGDPGESLSINIRTGLWSDFATGTKGGDFVSLLAARDGVTQGEAARKLARDFGMEASANRASYRAALNATGPSGSRYGEEAKRIWSKARPAVGSTVQLYLKSSRGITIPPPASIRVSYDGWHSPTRTGPWVVMIAGVSNPAGEIVAIQRTFLTGGGVKAPVVPVKMSLGPIKGNAIRLAAAGQRLIFAEGVESGLSVLQSLQAAGLPVWVTTGAEFFKDVWMPDYVREVIFAIDADDDGASERAAREATPRFQGEGRKVRIMRPKPGTDFNDMLRGTR